MSLPSSAPAREATRLRELTPQQWRSGIASWLGWLFDGLELHLYTLIALPLVVQLLDVPSAADPAVKEKSAYIQAAFLLGWAVGGAFFGRLGDILGRSRALALTVLTYAVCTGLCAFAQTWWQLMIFRFIAALGIGGEWAVGASLLAETWPRAWRPWLAAVLQTGVNLGILLGAAVVGILSLVLPPGGERWVFLVGVLPALMVFWIRRHVPEPETWRQAVTVAQPRARDLFRGAVASTTLRTTLVCALGLSAWWLFMFWHPQHFRKLLAAEGAPAGEITRLISASFFLVNFLAIAGNFFAGFLARHLGNRPAIVLLFAGLALAMGGAFAVPRDFAALAWFWCPAIGFFSGVFGLFTMYLPPLFPILLRTTGAGFCYNIGRVAAAVASLVFGLYAPVGDFRGALLWSGGLALAAALASCWLPVRTHEDEAT
ncbi:MAG: MFS transporter [Opitutaceae bacterium]|nr:MFS transporter [Opitutaceae bacterium]